MLQNWHCCFKRGLLSNWQLKQPPQLFERKILMKIKISFESMFGGVSHCHSLCNNEWKRFRRESHHHCCWQEGEWQKLEKSLFLMKLQTKCETHAKFHTWHNSKMAQWNNASLDYFCFRNTSTPSRKILALDCLTARTSILSTCVILI